MTVDEAGPVAGHLYPSPRRQLPRVSPKPTMHSSRIVPSPDGRTCFCFAPVLSVELLMMPDSHADLKYSVRAEPLNDVFEF